MLVEKVSKMQSKYTLCTETGVPELPPHPREKREYLGKCDNVNLILKKKKVLSQAIIEKRHPKLDQSELSTIKVR
jgi:hypothetical protein